MNRCVVSVVSSHGWSVSWNVAGVWRICACSLLEVGKGSGNPAPKLADRWKSAVWLGKSDLKDEHLVRTDGVVYARSVRRLEENLRAVVESPKKPNMTVDISPAAEPLAPPHACSKKNQRKTKKCRRSHWTQKETSGVSSSGRGEKRTETQESMSVKKGVMMKSLKRRATPVSPPDDLVKRRLLKKTDLKSDDVLVPVEIEDTDLLNTVNVLLNNETGEEAKAWNDESEKS